MKLGWLWPFRHAGLKAVSVGLAVVLWMAVAGEEVVERGLRVPLELQQFPAGLELTSEPPPFVDVRVRGASGTLSRLSPGDIVAMIDLRAARAGRRLFQLTPENVRTPFGVATVQVAPASVALEFEASATRVLPVLPEVAGDPAPGFVVGKVTAEPDTIEVIGPASAVTQASEAITDSVSVSGARDHVVETVSIGLLDSSLRLKYPRPARVRVEVLPGPRERTVAGLPVHLKNLGPGLIARAIPVTVDVVLRGTREGLSHVQTGEVAASVDLANLGVGDYSMPVDVDAPKEAGVARTIPATVQVRISSAAD